MTELRKMRKIVDQINQLEPELQALTSDQLQDKTSEFKQRINLGESLDDILPGHLQL